MTASAPSDQAARALLAFWRSAGVDMEEAEAVYAAAPRTAPVAPASSRQAPASVRREGSRLEAGAPSASVRRGGRQDAGATVDDARALARAADSIAALRAAVASFNGCALKATARNTVFSDGRDDAPV